MSYDELPPVLRRIIKISQDPRTPEEKEAARRFVLGHGSIKEYVEAQRKGRGGQ
jgi:hypothetical protein